MHAETLGPRGDVASPRAASPASEGLLHASPAGARAHNCSKRDPDARVMALIGDVAFFNLSD